MIKSTFSNGYEDIYNGKRAVTAGWMVITPSDTILSGHSINAKTAGKTARAAAADRCGLHIAYGARGAVPLRYLQAREKHAKDQGYKSHRELVQAAKSHRAAFVEQCHIEIVSV
tara:strand:+ start:1311 stop:1652 length:342 start_codon:yes stop_codon:yes gene_type:complete